MALLANDVCGSPVPFQMTFPWTFFDGKLFHSKLIRATQARNLVELCDGRVDMAYQIERIRNVIMMSSGSNFPAKQYPPGFKFNQPKSHKLWTPKKKTNPKHKDKVCTKKVNYFLHCHFVQKSWFFIPMCVISHKNDYKLQTKKNEQETNGDGNFKKDAEIVVEKVETVTSEK